MDSIFSILSRKQFDEPPEIAALKELVMAEFGVQVGVKINSGAIVVMVPNASLANTLRLRSPEIKQKCQIKGRLTFQIG